MNEAIVNEQLEAYHYATEVLSNEDLTVDTNDAARLHALADEAFIIARSAETIRYILIDASRDGRTLPKRLNKLNPTSVLQNASYQNFYELVGRTARSQGHSFRRQAKEAERKAHFFG